MAAGSPWGPEHFLQAEMGWWEPSLWARTGTLMVLSEGGAGQRPAWTSVSRSGGEEEAALSPLQAAEAAADLCHQHGCPSGPPGALSLHRKQPQDTGRALPAAGLPRGLPHQGVSSGLGVVAGPVRVSRRPPCAQVLRCGGSQEREDEQACADLWGQAAHAPGRACTGKPGSTQSAEARIPSPSFSPGPCGEGVDLRSVSCSR